MTAYRPPGDLERYRTILSAYSEELLQKTVERGCRFSHIKKEASPVRMLERTLASKRSVSRLVGQLDEPELLALSLFKRTPMVRWRWDQAMQMLASCGHPSPYRAVQGLLSVGLLCMQKQTSSDELHRFEIADGASGLALPFVMLASSIDTDHLEVPDLLPPLTEGVQCERWRQCDGWEFPLRLAVLWRLASLSPIKRTQQKKLFKRDQERILRNPLITSPLLDCPERIEEPGQFIYQLALSQGWLSDADDEQSPTDALGQIWPEDLGDLLIMCGRDMLLLDGWNELGAETPVGSFAQQVSTGRAMLLLLLGSLPPDSGATLEQLVARLEERQSPWNGEGELIGPLRYADVRSEMVRRWTRICLGGPLYQSGLVKQGHDESGTPVYGLTALGRRFLGDEVEVPPFPSYPQTLLAQPNHELIVYRQGLSLPLLGELIQFAEPKSLGAALTFEVNADSIYHGLETGISSDRILETLTTHGGREIPPALADSIRTWSQKRDQLTLYVSGSLFEFASRRDLEDALVRGLQGERISDTLLLVSGESDTALKHLRITASRDYRFPAQQCVTTGPDGVTLHVDTSKSDLMLDAELRRIAEPMSFGSSAGDQVYVITTSSLMSAIEQGLGIDYIEKWFRDRTGNPPPPSVMLLFRAADGSQLVARHRLVLHTESPLVADGLLQHPATAQLFEERLGPTSLAVDKSSVVKLREALVDLGIGFEIES